MTTEAGFLGNAEVTVVRYDPMRISRDELVADATRRGVASAVFERNDGRYRRAPESDQKRQIGGDSTSGFTAAQLTKRNAFVRTSAAAADRFLFPTQR